MGGEVQGRKKKVSENNCLLYDLDNISSEAEVVIHGFLQTRVGFHPNNLYSTVNSQSQAQLSFVRSPSLGIQVSIFSYFIFILLFFLFLSPLCAVCARVGKQRVWEVEAKQTCFSFTREARVYFRYQDSLNSYIKTLNLITSLQEIIIKSRFLNSARETRTSALKNPKQATVFLWCHWSGTGTCHVDPLNGQTHQVSNK